MMKHQRLVLSSRLPISAKACYPSFMSHIIGVDFDNTLVSYDDLFYEIALEKQLITAHIPRKKNLIREYVKRGPQGEAQWQALQSIAYGPEMYRAKLIPNVEDFLNWSTHTQTPVYIVSHKSLYLQNAALDWILKNKIISTHCLPDHVFFEPTRIKKIERIHKLGCTHFIDDLEEVFLESSFPKNIDKILFTEIQKDFSIPYSRVTYSWKEIVHYFASP
jgi:hypothetical protein